MHVLLDQGATRSLLLSWGHHHNRTWGREARRKEVASGHTPEALSQLWWEGAAVYSKGSFILLHSPFSLLPKFFSAEIYALNLDVILTLHRITSEA